MIKPYDNILLLLGGEVSLKQPVLISPTVALRSFKFRPSRSMALDRAFHLLCNVGSMVGRRSPMCEKTLES